MLRLYAGLRARAEERLEPGMAEEANHEFNCIVMLYGMQRDLRENLRRVLSVTRVTSPRLLSSARQFQKLAANPRVWRGSPKTELVGALKLCNNVTPRYT
jgi:hypothetical protein